MKKSTKIRITAFAAALVLTLAGFWCDTGARLDSAKTALEYSYRRALNDLTGYVSGMRSTLQKAPYVGTGSMQTQVTAQLLEQSGGAKAAMAVLPLSQERTEKISRFLSQTGDYALSLARRFSAGGTLEDEDAKNLQMLEEYAGKLLTALENAQARLSAEDGSIYADPMGFGNLKELDALATLDDDFDETAKEFAEAPSLLYDGPFSDHLNRREPLYLKDAGAITREQAAKKAAAFLQVEQDRPVFLSEGGNELSVYSFGMDGSRVNITKAGGEVAYFKTDALVKEQKLDYVDALTAASQLLNQLERGPCRETYYVIADNLCTVNFAATTVTEDGLEVICYPDLIKVTVELSGGGTVEYDAAGYLMNHRERDLVSPVLSQEEAQKSVSPRLEVIGAQCALIPTPGLDEVLCWEFHCKSEEGREFLVYINGETGLEEQLYLLQIDENGTLTI